MSKPPMIGIDFGTSKICISVFQNGKVDIISNEMNERTTPSRVAFNEKEKLVGNAANYQIKRNPTNTLFNIKRLLGVQFEDKFIQQNMKYWPFEIVKDLSSGLAQVQITFKGEKKKYFIEEILAMELQHIKKVASNYYGKEVKDAIIGVPNSFNSSQRQMLRDAGLISGLNIYFAIGESTLASFQYQLNKNDNAKENVVVFDLGAGFLNISILTLEEGLLEVKSVGGLSGLGGDDFDNRLIEYCANQFLKKTSKDIMQNPKALARLRIECEKAKKILSSATKATIELEGIMNGEDFYIEITREKFEDLCTDYFKKIIPCLETLLKEADMNKNQIDQIILTGGSSRIPKIQSMITDFFDGKQLNKSLNLEESVSCGAAIRAAICTNVKDEKVEKLILLDVSPFSIGFETVGGVMDVMVPKNSTIPCKKTKNFSTYADNQSSILVQLYEGERQLTKDNHFIGKMVFDGLPPGPREKNGIELSLDIGASFNIFVTAVEKTTGKCLNMGNMFSKERLDKNYMDKLIFEYQKEYERDKKITNIKSKIEEIFSWMQSNKNASDNEILNKKMELIDVVDKNC